MLADDEQPPEGATIETDVTKFTLTVTCPPGTTWENLLTHTVEDGWHMECKVRGKPVMGAIGDTLTVVSGRVARVLQAARDHEPSRRIMAADLAGKELAKIIHIPNKLINLVTR